MGSSNLLHASSYIISLVLFAHLLIMQMCYAHSHSWKDLHGTRKGNHANGLIHLKKYLARLGYMDNNNNSSISSNSTTDDVFDEALESAIKKYQGYFKYNITGFLDEETVELLSAPRCGVADHMNITPEFFRRKPHVWPLDERYLSYTYTSDISMDQTDEIVAAIESWEMNSPFVFYHTAETTANVYIGFKRWDHGDGKPFDGPGGVLAHAFFPTAGILHYDGDELWDTLPVPRKDHFDLQSVTLHELGHVLGLVHSDNPDDVMYPRFSHGELKRHLMAADVKAMRTLYPK